MDPKIKKTAEKVKPSQNRKYKPRILIVNNESKYMSDLKKTVEDHSKGNADIHTIHIKDAQNK